MEWYIILGIASVFNIFWYYWLQSFSIVVTLISENRSKSLRLHLNYFSCTFDKLVSESSIFFGITKNQIILLVDTNVLNENNIDQFLKKDVTITVHLRKTFLPKYQKQCHKWKDVLERTKYVLGKNKTKQWLQDNADVFWDRHFIRDSINVTNLDPTKVFVTPDLYPEKIGWYDVYRKGTFSENIFGEDAARLVLKENSV